MVAIYRWVSSWKPWNSSNSERAVNGDAAGRTLELNDAKQSSCSGSCVRTHASSALFLGEVPYGTWTGFTQCVVVSVLTAESIVKDVWTAPFVVNWYW